MAKQATDNDASFFRFSTTLGYPSTRPPWSPTAFPTKTGILITKIQNRKKSKVVHSTLNIERLTVSCTPRLDCHILIKEDLQPTTTTKEWKKMKFKKAIQCTTNILNQCSIQNNDFDKKTKRMQMKCSTLNKGVAWFIKSKLTLL